MRGRRQRVLIIHPDTDARNEMVSLFEDEDIDFHFYSNLAEAVRALRDLRCDCAILASELMETASANPVAILKAIDQEVPIIVTADNNTRNQENRIRAERVFYYHIRSIDREDLKLAVLEALRRRRGSLKE
jgi:DNA-binding NtrC family response regulator